MEGLRLDKGRRSGRSKVSSQNYVDDDFCQIFFHNFVIIFITDKIENYIFSVTSKIIDGVELSEEQVAPIYNPCQDQNQLTQE